MSASSLWDQQGRRGAWERNQVIFQLLFTHFWSFLHADLFLWNKHFQPKSIVSVHKTWYKQKTPLTTDPRHWTAFSPNHLLHLISEIAQVIAPYNATGAEQLTLAPGQLILIRKKNPGGWWEGELQVYQHKVYLYVMILFKSNTSSMEIMKLIV